jgi:hypothetical protein
MIMLPANFELSLDAFNQLLLHRTAGAPPIPVVPVRAFPIAAPDDAIALVNNHGTEQVWIEHLTDLTPENAQRVRQTLARREMTPLILRINQVSRFATPSRWQIETDRGTTELALKTEDDIRPLPSGGYLVTDTFGLQFKIPHRNQLDRQSQRYLARFL